MRRLLRKIAGLLGRIIRRRDVDPRLPSLVRAMIELSSKSTVREVVSSCSDRRQWGILTAAWIGVGEKEFGRAAAEKLKLEFRERVPLIDPSVLNNGLEGAIVTFRDSGVAPIFEGTRVVEFVAVDPAEVRVVPRFDGTQRVSLGCWSEISRVLDDADKALLDRRGEQEREQTERASALCRRVLDLVVSEASRYGCFEAEVVTVSGETRYQFVTADGQRGFGRIHRSVVTDLLAYLSKAGESSLKTKEDQSVTVRPLGNNTNFKLSWGEVTLALPEPADHVEQPKSTDTEPSQENRTPPSPIDTDDARPSAGALERREQPPKEAPIPILVVDDNPMFCRVLERLLERDGYAPCFDTDGAAAFKRLNDAKDFLPAAIICDLHMPIMNGRELLAKIRSDARFKDIPVVMLTSDDDIEAELSLIGSGADAFVSKAKDPRVMCAQVRRLVGQQHMRRAA